MEENASICPVCQIRVAPPEELTSGDSRSINCPRCMKFSISRTAAKQLENLDAKDRALLSHNIRKRQRPGQETLHLNSYILADLLKLEFPSLSDQSNNLLLWLGKNHEPGVWIYVDPAILQTIMGAKNLAGASFIMHHLRDEKFIVLGDPSKGNEQFGLTMEGWKRYDEINRGAILSRKAFMAMKFGNEDLRLILDKHFRLAVKATGFDLFRLDDRPRAGLIDDQLRVEIRTSRFLIADLTDENAGAYWEAGYAEGLGKPVIYTCERTKFETQKTHFDTNHHLTIPWDKANPEDAVSRLKATIRATLPDEAILTDSE